MFIALKQDCHGPHIQLGLRVTLARGMFLRDLEGRVWN